MTTMITSRIHRLTLTHFRNYRAASVETRADVVVLVGPNGAGKTNCLEAISFLSPGRGLRRAALDRSLRSRNRLLEVRNYDDHWCDAIEHETAELAVAVAASRGQTAIKLAAMLRQREASVFPSARLMLDGWMENALLTEPATSVEDRYRQILRDSRARDAAAGRTLNGPHLTDLQVIYAPKNIPAREASTGEQKALLIGLVLAHAKD